jgi:hypothetical protein
MSGGKSPILPLIDRLSVKWGDNNTGNNESSVEFHEDDSSDEQQQIEGRSEVVDGNTAETTVQVAEADAKKQRLVRTS